MNVFDAEYKVPWYRNISTDNHYWPELWRYIFCFVQSGEVSTVKGIKHTHTHTHTQHNTLTTHTHTQMHLIIKYTSHLVSKCSYNYSTGTILTAASKDTGKEAKI